MKVRLCLLFVLITGSIVVHAQTSPSRSPQNARGSDSGYQPGANQSYSGESPYKAKKRWWRKQSIDPVEAYYDRMEQVAKAYKRAERLSRRPQYSNPMYFGHRRPPKKHAPAKMRYCKECGIRH